jgi:hypothetical protein
MKKETLEMKETSFPPQIWTGMAMEAGDDVAGPPLLCLVMSSVVLSVAYYGTAPQVRTWPLGKGERCQCWYMYPSCQRVITPILAMLHT